MKKNILVIYYSQTGQLKDIADNLVIPFQKEAEYEVDYYRIMPEKDFAFPWKSEDFYGAFPNSFQQIPVEILAPPKEIREKEYDLVIFAYQIWFLTPSIPAVSFLKSAFATELLKDKKVVTLIGCRNMWAKAQQKTKKLLEEAGANLVGNIAFVDKHLNHISVITIAHWMMGGKKNKKYGIFPKPGVAEGDIQNANQFGKLILNAFKTSSYEDLQTQIRKEGGVELTPFIVFMDETANKMFAKWSSFILKNDKNRKLKIGMFKIYLLTAIWIISPIVYVLFMLTYPLRINSIRKKKIFYSGIK